MSAPSPAPVSRLAAAELEATLARQRIGTTLAKLQAKLNPKTLARQAIHDVADKGGAAAQVGLDTARRNPAALAGATAVAGLFLARHRLAALVRRTPRSR